MSKKTRGMVAFAGLCALSVFLLNCGSSTSRPAGLLYVLSQGADDVSSYAIDLNRGNLSLINSNASTCVTANSNPPVPCGFPQVILLDPTEADAFVLNQGVFNPGDPTANPPIPPSGVVPSIYGYTVKSDGSLAVTGDLTSVPSPPVSTACDQPPQGVFTACDQAVSMTRDAGGKFLFVITQGNQDLPPPLPPLPPQLIVLGTQPGSTALSVIGRSSLTFVPTSVATVTDPKGNLFLYVTGNKDLVSNNDNTVSEYLVDGSGNLTEPNPIFATASKPSAVVAVSTAPIGGIGGLFVYVANVTTNSVSVYQVCTVVTATCTQPDVNTFNMLPVGSPEQAGSYPAAMVVDPKSNFLFVASKNSAQVFGFRINATQGTLTALSPANMGTGASPIALAMHSSGKFLFVSNNAGSSISGFNVNTTSGAMSSPITITSAAQPAGLVAK